MQTFKKILLAGVVCGAFAAMLIAFGKWDAAVVGPVNALFGGNTAHNVDRFGQTSDQIAGKATDLGQQVLDGLLADKIDPAAVQDAVQAAPTPTNARIPTYNRDAFGTPWLDVDYNGCDTRNDILNRDLTSVVHTTGDCVVKTGVLADPYTGTIINFVQGSGASTAVQIDHIVPLGKAWGMGAYGWTDQQRAAFANDPAELLAVDGSSNLRKSDNGPGEWLPGNASYRCTYVAKFSYVVVKYSLAVSPADKAGITAALKTCP